MLLDTVQVTGHVKFKVTDEATGEVQEFEQNNLVVDVGRDYIASRIKEDTAVPMSHVAIGTGISAADLTDTGLVAEHARVAATIATNNNFVTFDALFVAGTFNNTNVSEAGIFNDAVAGTMLARLTFPVQNLSLTQTILVSWAIKIG